MDPIAQLASEGRKESSGSFTMDLIAARRKLTKVGELEPGLMLGKILQAAVVARASQVRFTVGAREVMAKINFPESAGTDQEVQEHMATAFALAQGLRPRELTWVCGGPARSFVGRANGEGPLRTQGMAVFRLEGQYVSFWDELRALVVARRDAGALLRERAYLCPIPVFLDAVRINKPAVAEILPGCDVIQLARRGGLARAQMVAPCPRACQAQMVWLAGNTYRGKKSFGHSPSPMRSLKTVVFEGAEDVRTMERDEAAYSAERVMPTPGLPLCNHVKSNAAGEPFLVQSQSEWANPEAYLSPETTRESFDPHLCARRWISLFDNPQQPSELWPVQDGLLLNKLVLARCLPGCRVIMPVSAMNLDLDQLSVVQDELFQELQEELKGELQRLSEFWGGLQQKSWVHPTTV